MLVGVLSTLEAESRQCHGPLTIGETRWCQSERVLNSHTHLMQAFTSGARTFLPDFKHQVPRWSDIQVKHSKACFQTICSLCLPTCVYQTASQDVRWLSWLTEEEVKSNMKLFPPTPLRATRSSLATLLTPSAMAWSVSSRGPSTVLPSSVGPQLAL